nr:Transposon Tf2-12 polyprotein [Ipomoea batatas]
MGQQPLTSHFNHLTSRAQGTQRSRVIKMTKAWEADGKRRPQEYNVGDLALIKFILQQFKAFRCLHKGLVQRFFQIIFKIPYFIFLFSSLRPTFGILDSGEAVECRRERDRRWTVDGSAEYVVFSSLSQGLMGYGACLGQSEDKLGHSKSVLVPLFIYPIYYRWNLLVLGLNI